MKRLSSLNLVLLFLVAVASLVRSWKLVGRPDGSNLVVPLEVLGNETTVDSFFPVESQYGAIGLFYLLVSIVVMFNLEGHKLFTIAAGAIMSIWILIRMALGQAFVLFWHIPLFTVGFFLMVSGVVLLIKEKRMPAVQAQSTSV